MLIFQYPGKDRTGANDIALFHWVGQYSGFIKPGAVEIAQALEPDKLTYLSPQPCNFTAVGLCIYHLHLSGPLVSFSKNNK